MWIVGLKLFVPCSIYFSFEKNLEQRKVDSCFSCKVPRLKERREAEWNFEDDNEVNDWTSKDQEAVSLKKDCVFNNAWLSKQKPTSGFFPRQSRIMINFDALKFLQGRYFSGS